MTQKAIKPEIRFAGFTDEWEEQKFSDLVLIERGGSPRPIDSYITDEPNGLNWVKIGDAPEQGRYITKTAEKIKPEGLSKTREVQPGDLILSNSMSFGRPYIMGIHGCIHDGWLLIRDIYKRFDLKFLCHMLGSKMMIRQYRMFAAGSTVNNLNKDLVGNTKVNIPSIKEQCSIGDYLEALDLFITLQQRKVEKFQNIKKSMLEKMFPKDGSRIPEIRFAGFTGDWEQKKLGGIADTFSGGTPTAGNKDFYGGSIPFIRSGEISADHTELFITKRGLENSSAAMVSEGDILYALYGATSGEVSRSKINGAINQAILAILPHSGYDSEFIMQWLRMKKSAIVNTYLQGGQGNLSGIIVKSLIVDIPSEAEQVLIGKYLTTFDRLITLQQRKLEKLQNVKKAMLEKMFV